MNRNITTLGLANMLPIILVILFGTNCGAEDRSKPTNRQSSSRAIASVQEFGLRDRKPAGMTVSLQDTMYDFDVFEALPVTGSEWVITVLFPGEDEMTLLGNAVFSPGAETVYYTGVRSFEYEYVATSQAEYLYEAGVIDEYYVFQRPKQPTWSYVATFDTLAEAEFAADYIESITDKITKISSVLVESFSMMTP